MKWFKKYYIHFIAWIFLITWETFAALYLAQRKPEFLVYAGHYGITIIIFYANVIYVMPVCIRWLGQYVGVLLIVITYLISYLIGHYVIDIGLFAIDPSLVPRYSGINSNYIIANLYRGVFFLAISLGYFYLKGYFSLQVTQFQAIIERQNFERQLATAQNLYLKAQINPHFLFNVLHFINYKLDPKSEASEALLRLSNIMHFAFSSKDAAETIRIGDELTQVEELVALQEMRGNRFEGLKISYDLVVCDLRLIPLVLLTLVENVYKHGDLSNNAAFLSLDIDEDQELLVIKTLNQIGGQQLPSDQTGMDNIRTRLVNAYGDATQFEYGIKDDSFQVRIALPFSAVKP